MFKSRHTFADVLVQLAQTHIIGALPLLDSQEAHVLFVSSGGRVLWGEGVTSLDSHDAVKRLKIPATILIILKLTLHGCASLLVIIFILLLCISTNLCE